MKKYFQIYLVAFFLVALNSTITAQVFRISSFGQQNHVNGDFGKSEANNPNAGYVDWGVSGGLEFNYYTKNKLGFGIRLINQSYVRDVDGFESDFKNGLGLSDNEFDITQPYNYFSIGTDFGISYLIDIDEKWQVEPYLFVGGRRLARRNINAIYTENGNTTQYQSKLPVFYGYNINPGAKIHWNFQKRFGIFLSLEYQISQFISDTETTVTSSANSLEINYIESSYDINSFNVGFGLAFRFGKGLDE